MSAPRRVSVLLASLALLAGCPAAPKPPPAAPEALQVPQAPQAPQGPQGPQAPRAPPAAGVARYVVGGDSRNDSAHVLPWAFREAKARGAEAFIFLGDMELSPALDSHFYDALRELDPVSFFPVLGNHEVYVFGFIATGKREAERKFQERFLGNARTPVKNGFRDKVVYSVDLPGGLHFVALDNVSQHGFGADQLAWLASDLERARSTDSVRHVVVGMHKPLAKNGVTTHGMDDDGAQGLADSEAALALFGKHRVSLILQSHAHEFWELKENGIPAYVTGGLGAPLTRSDPEHGFHHFLQLDVTPEKIHVTVVRFDGAPSVGAEEAD
jgi:hypothetical protein